MPDNLVILLVAVLAAILIGFAVRRFNGHFRGAAKAEVPVEGASSAPGIGREAQERSTTPPALPLRLSPTDIAADLGQKATLLQFSSAFCAPCRSTRRVLAEVAQLVPGVAHVELDAEHNLELVRRLGVMRTPTTFVLDADGTIVTRASGAPRKADVVAALGRVIS